MKSKNRRIIIILFFAMILFPHIVSEIINVHKTAKPENNKIDQTPQIDSKLTTTPKNNEIDQTPQIDSKLTTSQPRFKRGDRFHLSGTITKVKRAYIGFSGTIALDVTIMHSGVPGTLTPGTETFRAYATLVDAHNIKVGNIDNFDNAVGREVDFVIEWHDDQWILVELVGK